MGSMDLQSLGSGTDGSVFVDTGKMGGGDDGVKHENPFKRGDKPEDELCDFTNEFVIWLAEDFDHYVETGEINGKRYKVKALKIDEAGSEIDIEDVVMKGLKLEEPAIVNGLNDPTQIEVLEINSGRKLALAVRGCSEATGGIPPKENDLPAGVGQTPVAPAMACSVKSEPITLVLANGYFVGVKAGDSFFYIRVTDVDAEGSTIRIAEDKNAEGTEVSGLIPGESKPVEDFEDIHVEVTEIFEGGLRLAVGKCDEMPAEFSEGGDLLPLMDTNPPVAYQEAEADSCSWIEGQKFKGNYFGSASGVIKFKVSPDERSVSGAATLENLNTTLDISGDVTCKKDGQLIIKFSGSKEDEANLVFTGQFIYNENRFNGMFSGQVDGKNKNGNFTAMM